MPGGIPRAEEATQIRYSPDADVLVISLRTGRPYDSNDLCEGIIVHYGEDEAPLQIEILDASRIIDMNAIDVSLRELLPFHEVAS